MDIPTNTLCNLDCMDTLYNIGNDQSNTSTVNNPTCTHLSRKIFSNHFFSGNSSPGKQNSTVATTKEIIAGQKVLMVIFIRLLIVYVARVCIHLSSSIKQT